MHRAWHFLFLLLLWTGNGEARAQEVYGAAPKWLDDGGSWFEMKSLQGSWTVLTMAYGACRRICSTSLRTLEQVQALADAQNKALHFVVVGLDPAQDKPADWAELRKERHLTRANWHFLSGDANSTRALAQRLGVRYWRYGDHTMHDFRIVLLSPEGRLTRSLDSFDEPVQRMLP